MLFDMQTSHCMRLTVTVRVFILFLVLCFTTASASETRSIQGPVTAFYNVYLKVRPSGVPAKRDLKKFKPYLSSELTKLLEEAGKSEIKYKKETKGEVPPLVEGDIFTSLFEGANSFRVLSCTENIKQGSCLVEFRLEEGKSISKWNDKIFLRKERGNWKVDDVEFLGDWEFMHKGLLKDLLKDIIKEESDK